MADNSTTMFTAPLESPYIHGRSPGAIAVTVLSFFALLLCIPPFVWHIKSRNVAAASLVAWVILANISIFINANIWPTDDLSNWWNGIGLCDVEVRLQNASSIGITGALACIFRSLAMVLDTDNTVLVPTTAQRRRRLAFEIFFCFVAPAYMIGIYYIVQNSRYYIVGITGCAPAFDQSWPSIALVFVWPVVFCLIDAYYCSIVIYRVRKYRRQFASIISSSSSSLNQSRFMRLFIISLILILAILPVQLYVFYRNVIQTNMAFSWSRVHSIHFWDIVLVPSFGEVTFDRWIQVASGFLVFFFFGFGKDATLMYRSWLLKLGLGRFFPTLEHPHIQDRTTSSSLSSRLGSSISSKAKLIFLLARRHSSTTIANRHDSVSTTTEVHTPSPSDPIKSFIRFPHYNKPEATQSPSTKSSTSRFIYFFSRLNPFPTSTKSHDVEKQMPVTFVGNEATVVETSVWSAGRAGTSLGSPIKMNSVKVKKDLTQLTEKEEV